MPEAVELSEAEQDAVLLRIYALAQRQAEKLVCSGYREDMVQDLALEWLERLRAGDWEVPPEQWGEFVVAEIRNWKVANRRKRRREMARDAIHLELITNMAREWMLPELKLEEDELREFADRIQHTLPRKCVRAHRMVREDQMSYAEVGRRLRVSADRVHEYVRTVHRAFRGALHDVDITPSSARPDVRKARARRRPLKVRRHRRPGAAQRGRGADTPRAVP
jgi:DNA-directed RNA polymerase specialized sigma24 family protein